MKKEKIFSLVIAILVLSSFGIVQASEDFTIEVKEQPDGVYNYGDILQTSVEVTSQKNMQSTSKIRTELFCNGSEIDVIEERSLFLEEAGDEKILDIFDDINRTKYPKSECKLKIKIADDAYVMTNKFTVSEKIGVNFETDKESYNPGEEVKIKGDALKDNSEIVEGYVNVYFQNKSKKLDSLNKENFSAEFTLPENLSSGEYDIKVKVYEKNPDEDIINQGTKEKNISINQIPTELDLGIEDKSINPGESAVIKTLLKDQSGEKIDSNSTIQVRNPKQEIKTFSVKTGEEVKYKIENKTKPSQYSVSASSEGLVTNSSFNVSEYPKVDYELINRTLFVENTGNVDYNDTIELKIGNHTIVINSSIPYNETKDFYLTAPEGNYTISVLGQEEKKELAENVLLTGSAVSADSSKGAGFSFSILVWFFVVLVIGAMVLMIHKKGYKRTIIGKIKKPKLRFGKKKKEEQEQEETPKKEADVEGSLIDPSKPAILSASIKGEKQSGNLVCLKIKNYDEVIQSRTHAKMALNKIASIAEENKAYTYDNRGNIFFIFAPIATRTFENEKYAMNLAREAKSILDNHNKTARQKIDYGISVNYGSLVAKKDKTSLQFMGAGNFFTSGKKLASYSDNEILISKDVRNRTGSHIKTEKRELGENKDLEAYKVSEVSKEREQNQKFINDFVKRNKGMFKK